MKRMLRRGKAWITAAAVIIILLNCGGITLVGASNSDTGTAVYTNENHEVRLDYSTEPDMLSHMRLSCENSRFALYYQPETMVIALYNKDDDRFFFSNPYNAAKSQFYTGDIRKNLESQVVLTYINHEKNTLGNLWSSTDCAEYGQYSIQSNPGGFEYDMTIGKIQTETLCPVALSTQRYEVLSTKLTGRALRRFQVFYKHTSLNSASPDEKQKLTTQYPGIAEGDIYVLGDLSDKEKTELEGYLKGIGYTYEDMQRDTEKYKGSSQAVAKPATPSFHLKVDYTLTEKGLTVTIPNDSISYDTKQYTLVSIRLLEFFGADKPETEGNGYLFIPDGSGSIIKFGNTNSNRLLRIAGRVYGRDAVIKQTLDERSSKQFFLPVYGVVRNNGSALFAHIDSGAEMSEITASLGKPNSEYFTVSNTFLLTQYEQLTLSTAVESLNSKVKVYSYDKNSYKGNFTVRYYPLSGSDANYSGMARLYKTILTEQGMVANTRTVSASIGVDLLGSALYNTKKLGFNVKDDAVLTTYGQSSEIGDYFKDKGIANLAMTLIGWEKGGMNAGAADNIRLSSVLGGKKQFENLLSWANANETSVYPEADLLFVHYDKLFDGFNKNTDSSRQLDNSYAGIQKYQPELSDFGKISYAISPHKYGEFWNKFLKRYKEFKVNNLSLGSFGSYLNSNMASKHAVNREQSLLQITSWLEEISQQYNLSFDGGNEYVLPFAKQLKDIATSDSGFSGESASVPFIQMAVSGSIPYFSEPVNLDGNWDTAVLRCIESDTIPSFVLAYDNVSLLKKTDFNAYYATSFEFLKDKIISSYQQVEKALFPAKGSPLVSHCILSDDVVCSSYENGVKVYVNYGDQVFNCDGVSVPAKSSITFS